MAEHFVKIPEAEKEDCVAVIRFDLLILLHHWRDFCHVCSLAKSAWVSKKWELRVDVDFVAVFTLGLDRI